MSVYRGNTAYRRAQLEEAVRQGQQAALDPDHDPFAGIPNADDQDYAHWNLRSADDRYQTGALAGHTQTARAHLAQAHYDAATAVPPGEADEVFTPRNADSTPEAFPSTAISPSEVLGLPPAPTRIETRARPSDYPDEATW